MIPRLPEEVVLLILEQVTDKRDLNTLCQVSKAFNFILAPRLWRHLTIRTRDEQSCDKVGFPIDIDENGNVKGPVKNIKTIEVLSHFHQVFSERCVHYYDDVAPYGAGQVEYPHLDDLRDCVRKALHAVEKDALEKFTWWTGTCTPSEVLMDIYNFQKSIKNLSLCTGGACDTNLDGDDPIELPGLSSLKALSWSNIHSPSDLSCLRTLIENNREGLRELRLDFGNMLDYSYEEWENEDENRFATNIIGLPGWPPEGENERIRFPRLEVLSIAGVDVGEDIDTIAIQLMHAFNFRHLTSLSIRDCPGTAEFLEGFYSAHDIERPIKLTSLEIVYRKAPDWISKIITDMLSHFLDDFTFTNLFIGSGGLNEKGISICIRFNHPGLVDGALLCPPGRSIAGYEIEKLLELNPLSYRPFQDMSLKCLGLDYPPDDMRALLFPFTNHTSLQILHMRACVRDLPHPSHSRQLETFYEYKDTESKSYHNIAKKSIAPQARDPLWPFHATKNGEIMDLPRDLFEFLKWLFSPDGVTSLRVFAFGDFSHNGRYRAYNHIFCPCDEPIEELRERDEPGLKLNFRPIRKTDHVLWDLIEKNKDFLSACPTAPLFED